MKSRQTEYGKGDNARIENKKDYDKQYMNIDGISSSRIIELDKSDDPSKIGYYCQLRRGELAGPFNTWQSAKKHLENYEKE